MRLALEPEDPVPLAHPVMAGLAIAALVAGHDLLGDDPVTLADTPLLGRALAKRHDPAGVLVPGNDRPLDVPAGAVLAPEERSAEEALHVRRADPDRADLDHQLARSRLRHGHFLDPVIARSMRHDRQHCLVHDVLLNCSTKSAFSALILPRTRHPGNGTCPAHR